MRISKPSSQIFRSLVALITLASVTVTTLTMVALAGREQKGAPSRRLTEEQRITHVLNRLGFGARPGDVERVRALGIEKYIEQQLNPSQISDQVAEAKVEDLSTLTMTTAQLYEKYPQPGQILRQLQRRGELPNDAANKSDTSPSALTPDWRTTPFLA